MKIKLVCWFCDGMGFIKIMKYLMPKRSHKSYEYITCVCCKGVGWLQGYGYMNKVQA